MPYYALTKIPLAPNGCNFASKYKIKDKREKHLH